MNALKLMITDTDENGSIKKRDSYILYSASFLSHFVFWIILLFYHNRFYFAVTFGFAPFITES